eukprot:TRINITY_DN35316_c0_g1_i1.p1 TRINITY_DN35316_c0_g1~~TRINITY_DN35316_c0_g1_i1.p1  ORF type:complete len:691 (-),score=112.33 TRINITY_DN35316_c0_g1_i1:306-2378(-)
MAQNLAIDLKPYEHSPVHFAVAKRDYEALRRIIAALPRLPKAGEVHSEEESIAAEQKADVLSASIDRRDVPGRETPLHLAVRLKDATAVDLLMSAGADWSLQNEQGWSALQEAICAREDELALIITRHYQPLAWAKWCRRLPRIIAVMRRMRDFYMEITFQFESSVIPFIGRIAPSDTYKIWKRGSNLRADMTLAGFDGFKIQRSDQSFLFLGEGSEDGKLASGSLLMLNHKDREITDALEGAGSTPTEAEVAREVAQMSQTSLYRPGVDVTGAELVPQTNWRGREKTEQVGAWKAKIYDMHHVVVSIRSRKFPGAMSDEELFAAESDNFDVEHAGYEEILTEEEKRQLENVLESSGHGGHNDEVEENLPGSSHHGPNEDSEDDDSGAFRPNGGHRHHIASPSVDLKHGKAKDDKRSWFQWGKKPVKNDGIKRSGSSRRSHSTDTVGTSNIDDDSSSPSNRFANLSHSGSQRSQADFPVSSKKGKEKAGKKGKKEGEKAKKPSTASDESEYKKGVKPVLWLTPDFPLKTEELLPLLDILANKVKAVRRLRDLLTTKLPAGTFPVKVAIPIIPTIRVVVTFSKFHDLQPLEEFATPVSSPAHFETKGKDVENPKPSGSWLSWLAGSQGHVEGSSSVTEDQFDNDYDPFFIPHDYKWVGLNEKKRRMKTKRSKPKKDKKAESSKALCDGCSH